MSEPDSPRPVNWIEFHQEVGGIHGALSREFNGLRTTAGWLAISFGLWALLIGVIIVTGNEKGRP